MNIKLSDLKTTEDCFKAISIIGDDPKNRAKNGKLKGPAQKLIEKIQDRFDRLEEKERGR